VVLAVALASPGCVARPIFECVDDGDCQGAAAEPEIAVHCEATGYCSADDATCDSGRRYGELSGPVGGRCVGDDGDDGDAGAPCALEASGPIVATSSGQVIERLHIVADGEPGIVVHGVSDVTIRDVWIEHAGAPGIHLDGADGLRIEDVVIDQVGTDPSAGCTGGDFDAANLGGGSSTGLVVARARMTGGSNGVRLAGVPGARFTDLELHDARATDGFAFNLSHSDGATLERFSSVNDPGTSCVGHVIYLGESSDVTVREGFVEGNQYDYAAGVIYYMGDEPSVTGGLTEDVEVVGTSGSCFQVYPGRDVTFRRTRCRDPICDASFFSGWSARDDSTGCVIEDSTYAGECFSEASSEHYASADVTWLEDPPPGRAPLDLAFCWE
jgi:hypothetical protein